MEFIIIIIIIIVVIFIIYTVMTSTTYTKTDANGNKYKIKETFWGIERSPDDSWMSLLKSLDRHENLKDITDLDSYYKALREYYSEYGKDMLRLEIIMRLLHTYHLDKVLNKSAGDIQKDLKIIANGEELPDEKLPIYKTKRWEELKQKRGKELKSDLNVDFSDASFSDIFGDIFGDSNSNNNIFGDSNSNSNSNNNIYDIKSYLNTLERYYLEFSNYMFDKDVINEFIRIYQLDTKFQIGYEDVIRDLHKIVEDYSKRNKTVQHQNSNHTPPVQTQSTQVQNKNITPPVQTQSTQVQNISNSILDEYMLIETVRTMPLWLNSESVSISKNSSINSLCTGLVNNAMSDFATQETFVQFENIIQQKRLRTSNKAEYNRKMENNIFYELFCYSYLINVFEAVPKIMSGNLNVNFEKYVSLAENECRKRVQNLDQEKRKIYNIETILNKYNQSTTQYKMPNLGLINQRENDYIIAQLMHNCVIPCIAPLFYDSKEQWKIFNTISAKEFAQTLDVYLSQAISMRLSTYAGDKIFNI